MTSRDANGFWMYKIPGMFLAKTTTYCCQGIWAFLCWCKWVRYGFFPLPGISAWVETVSINQGPYILRQEEIGLGSERIHCNGLVRKERKFIRKPAQGRGPFYVHTKGPRWTKIWTPFWFVLTLDGLLQALSLWDGSKFCKVKVSTTLVGNTGTHDVINM